MEMIKANRLCPFLNEMRLQSSSLSPSLARFREAEAGPWLVASEEGIFLLDLLTGGLETVLAINVACD